MANIQVSNNTPVQAAKSESVVQKAETAIGKHLKAAKDALFGPTGSAVLAGAASGALLAGLPGAVVGGAVGLGIGASVHAAKEHKTALSLANAGLAGAVAAMAFPPAGALLVGVGAFAFASGAAQNAASKIGNFLGLHGKDKAEPAPAQ